MEAPCPVGPFTPPGCLDLTRTTGSDATLAGLLATAASVFIVLILQERKRRSATEQEARDTVLSLLVSVFLSTLLAAFTFGLLTGQVPTIKITVLLNVASPALAAGALQFLSSIGWLLSWHQVGRTPFRIAQQALRLVLGMVLEFLLVDYNDLLKVKMPGAFPGVVYVVAPILAAILLIVIAWRVPKALKRRALSKEEDYARIYAQSSLFIAAGCTLLFGIIEEFPSTILQNAPDWVYYLGALLLMVVLGWFVCLSELSWPPQSLAYTASSSTQQPQQTPNQPGPPQTLTVSTSPTELPKNRHTGATQAVRIPSVLAPATEPQKNYLEPSSDGKSSGEEPPLPPKESASPSVKRRSTKKPAVRYSPLSRPPCAQT